jgi:hypothetical protein
VQNRKACRRDLSNKRRHGIHHEVQGDQFIAAKGDQTILKSDFEKAYHSAEVDPGEMEKIVKGPAYVWSVLHDRRIV